MEVKINREIRNYTESMFFGLSMRQCVFSLLAVVVAVGLYFLLKPYVGTETVARVTGIRKEAYITVVETAAPAGYVLDKTPHGVHIDPYDPAIEDDPVLTVTNRARPALRILKYDLTSNKPMPDVTFEVWHDGDLFGEYTTNASQIRDFQGVNMLCDIGNGTMNIMFINDRKPAADRMFTEKYGTHQCMLAVRENVMRTHHATVDDTIINRVLRFGTADIQADYLNTIQETAAGYVREIFRILREHEYNPALAGHENSKITMDIYAKVKYNKPHQLLPIVNEAFSQNKENSPLVSRGLKYGLNWRGALKKP